MPYQIIWHENRRCVTFELLADLSKEEMFAACYELRDDVFSTVMHNVHIIVDLKSMKSYPQDLQALTEATKIYSRHPNLGWVLVMGLDNPIAKFLANVMFQVSKAKHKLVSNQEEAEAILRKVDPMFS